MEKVWHPCLSGCVLVLAVLLLHHHWQIIAAPVPLDLYEGTMPWITSLIADGHNPYTRAFQPMAADVYPPLYNLLVAPLTLLFDNSLLLHRVVSGLFILASVALCWRAAIHAGANRPAAATAGALLYAALLFYITPVASTNALGVLLFLLTVLVPWLRGFSNQSLAIALLCGLLSFYAKQYFILGMAILCLYLLLCISVKRALTLGFTFAGLLLASLSIVHITSPYYLDNTLFAPQAAIVGLYMTDIMILQVGTFLQVYWPALVIILSVLLAQQRGLGGHGDSPSETTGALLRRRLDYPWFCFLWASLVTVVTFGGNPGNYMSYFFQLMTPFLVLLLARALSALQGLRLWLAPLVIVSLVQCYIILPRDFSVDLAPWDEVHGLIDQNTEILATQMLLMSLLERDKPIYQDGHTFYFPLAKHKPALFRKRDPALRVEAVWSEYITGLYRRIEAGKFDLVLVSPWEMRGIFERNPPPFSSLGGREFLAAHYEKTRVIPLSMTQRYGGGTYRVQVWQPKSRQPLAPQGRADSGGFTSGRSGGR